MRVTLSHSVIAATADSNQLFCNWSWSKQFIVNLGHQLSCLLASELELHLSPLSQSILVFLSVSFNFGDIVDPFYNLDFFAQLLTSKDSKYFPQ